MAISQHENINCQLNFSEIFDEIKNKKEFFKKVHARDNINNFLIISYVQLKIIKNSW